jgi:hypothetical protein
MTLAHRERLARLGEDARGRVSERAAILHYDAWLAWAEADERALRDEAHRQRSLFGGDL